MGWRPVTDPEVLKAFDAKVPKTVEGAPTTPEDVAAAETPADDSLEGIARKTLSGEGVAEIPSALGLKPKVTGSEAVKAIDYAKRYQGRLPEYRAVSGNILESPVQFVSNVAADAVGGLASPVSLPVELGIAAARALPDIAANAIADAAAGAYRAGVQGPAEKLFGEAAAKALAAQQGRGQYRTLDAIERRKDAYVEMAKGFLWGAAPAEVETIQRLAAGESIPDAARAGWEAFKAYPLASILPMVHAGKKAMEVGGTPVVDRQGTIEKTILDKPVVLNAAGKAVFEALPDKARQVAFDVPPKDMRKTVATKGGAVLTLMKSKSEAAQGIYDAVTRHNAIRDIQTAMADPTYANTLEADKFAAVEGTLPGVDKRMNAVAFDPATRQVADQLGNELMASGMTLDQAQLAVPFIAFEALRQSHMHGVKDVPTALVDAYNGIQNHPNKAMFVAVLQHQIDASMQNPAFLAAADKAWTSPNSEFSWTPAKDMAQRDGYIEAMNRVREMDKANGTPSFDLQHPQLGEMRRDYTYALFDSMVDSAASTPAGRERVAAVLRAKPMSRFLANPGAPADVQALAAWANQPDGPRRKYMDAINQASLEIAQNYGVDPVVVAKHTDRYLSRAFHEAIEGQAQLDSMLAALETNPLQAARIGALNKSNRHKRTLSDADSAAWMMQKVANGELDLHDILSATAAHMMGTSSHLQAMSDLHDFLSTAGQLHDPAAGPAPKGWVQLSKELAAPKNSAASGTPYNYQIGKLAGKYVEPHVGKALGLYQDALTQYGTGVLPLWRFTHTVGNLPFYQIRNAIQDPLPVQAITGLTTYKGEGRALYEKASSALQRYAKSIGQFKSVEPGAGPHKAMLDPELAMAMQYGVVEPLLKTLNDSEALGYTGDVMSLAKRLGDASISSADPKARLQGVAEVMAHARTVKSIPHDLKDAFLAGKEKALAENDRLDLLQTPRPGKAIPLASAFANGLHEKLGESTLAQATAVAEQSRRLWAWLVAREKLKMAPQDAAVFVSSVMYGAGERPPSFWEQFRESAPWLHRAGPTIEGVATLFALPPFLRFGNWQMKTSMQRMLNDPALWANAAFVRGAQAYNEQDLMDNGDGTKEAWKTRLANAAIKHNLSQEQVLGKASTIAEFVEGVGLTDLAAAIRRRDPLVTVDLRDVTGGQTWTQNLEFDLPGAEFVLQSGALGKATATALDPNLQDPYTGQDAIRQGDPSARHKVMRMGEILAMSLLPQSAYGIAKTLVNTGVSAIGEPVGQTKRGTQFNPLAASKAVLPVTPFSTLDHMDVMARMGSLVKRKEQEINSAAASDQSAILRSESPANRSHVAAIADLNAQAKLAKMKLGFSMAYLGLPLSEAMKQSRAIEEKRQALKGKLDVDLLTELRQSSSWRALDRAVSKTLELFDSEVSDK